MGPSLELYFDSADVLAEKKDYISFVTHTIGCVKVETIRYALNFCPN